MFVLYKLITVFIDNFKYHIVNHVSAKVFIAFCDVFLSGLQWFAYKGNVLSAMLRRRDYTLFIKVVRNLLHAGTLGNMWICHLLYYECNDNIKKK